MSNSNKIAYEAFQAINNDNIITKLTHFQNYLDQLCNKIYNTIR